MREAAEMSKATSDYFAAPLEDNLFEWHFTVRGPEDTEFQVALQQYFIIIDLFFPGWSLSWPYYSACRIPHETTRYYSPYSK